MRANQSYKNLLISLALLSGAAPVCGKGFTLQGKIQRVMDGDTVQLLTENSAKVKIRLLSIDAPESNQSYGKESTQHLISLSQSERVTARCIGIDKYKRSLCKLLVNEVDLNLEQVKGGMAWHYKAYSSSQSKSDDEFYAAAEKSAREARIGIWASDSISPPWEFRKGTTDSKIRGKSHGEGTVIKMSRAKICHQPGGKHYTKTKNFQTFNSLDDCLEAGGRLPKS